MYNNISETPWFHVTPSPSLLSIWLPGRRDTLRLPLPLSPPPWGALLSQRLLPPLPLLPLSPLTTSTTARCSAQEQVGIKQILKEMSHNLNLHCFRLQLSGQPRPLLPSVSVHKRQRQQIQQQLQQQQIQQQLQQRALCQAGAQSEAIYPLTEPFSSSQIQSQHQLWKMKQHKRRVDTNANDVSEKDPSQNITISSCAIIKSNLCDAIMYEHKMHVEYKILRLLERLILKSFHFKECLPCKSRTSYKWTRGILYLSCGHGPCHRGVRIRNSSNL